MNELTPAEIRELAHILGRSVEDIIEMGLTREKGAALKSLFGGIASNDIGQLAHRLALSAERAGIVGPALKTAFKEKETPVRDQQLRELSRLLGCPADAITPASLERLKSYLRLNGPRQSWIDAALPGLAPQGNPQQMKVGQFADNLLADVYAIQKQDAERELYSHLVQKAWKDNKL